MLLAVIPVSFAGDIWLRVDTDRQTLSVMEGESVRLTFEDIAIGRYGVTKDKRKGDNRTPLGKFNIGWIKESSRFHLFMGLDFPNPDIARRALRKGDIDRDQWQRIRQAFHMGETPPQNTPLGGYIGIHGVGAGDLEIHGQYNWTNGCIAITNDQMDELAEWVTIGTPVEIH